MKNLSSSLLIKIVTPRLIAKALMTLDKSTAIVVGVCWGVALVTLVAALLAVHASVDAKKQADAAIVAAPVLPQEVKSKINVKEGRDIVARLQHQFPDIKFDLDGTPAVIIKSDDGAQFHEWVNALAYLDTLSPEYQWRLRSLCVGKCLGADLMKAEVTGERVVFNLPPPKQ